MTPDTVPGADADLPLQTAVSPPFYRLILRSKYVKPLLKALLGLGIAIPLALSVILMTALDELQIRLTSVETAFRNGQLNQLSSKVTALEQKLAAQEARFVTKAMIEQSLTPVQQAAAESGRQLVTLSETSTAAQQRITRQESGLEQLRTELGSLREGLEKLKKASEAPTVAAKPPAAVRNTPVSTNAAKKSSRSAKSAPLAAPFILTGIEHRGGQVYAVVAPRGATSLSQMQLLMPGDAAWGWTLQSLNGNEAIFTVNGRQQRLSL